MSQTENGHKTPALPTSLTRAVRDRQGLLWVCQRHDLLPGLEPHAYDLAAAEASLLYRKHPTRVDVTLASLYWEAVWLEGAASPLQSAIRQTIETQPSRTRRALVTLADAADAVAEVSQEFLPIAVLPGLLAQNTATGSRYGSTKARARERIAFDLASRLTKYPGRTLIVIGARRQANLERLYEALEDCPITDLQVLIACPNAADPITPPSNPTVAATLWTHSEEELCDVLAEAGIRPHSPCPSGRFGVGVGR